MQSRSRTIAEYVREDGSCPYRDWFESLDPGAAAKVAVAVVRLGAGNTSALKWIGDIGEIRIDSGPGYRIYLGHGPGSMVLLWGGTKRSQSRDIRKARDLRAEFTKRRNTDR